MIYKSIADRLRLRLNSADYAIGCRLPCEKKLASEFAVSRMTLRRAIDLLISWGLIERRHGSGSWVIKKDVHHETSNLTGFVEVMRTQGKEVVSEVLSFSMMPAPPAIASLLRINGGEKVYASQRVRSVAGKPLMVEESYMPYRLFRHLSVAHLEGSKFSYIEDECSIVISGNYETLTPVLADSRTAALLNIAESTPILRITSLSYSDKGEFLNYSIIFRSASEYQVDYHLRRHREQSPGKGPDH